jgi:hypothetical protein
MRDVGASMLFLPGSAAFTTNKELHPCITAYCGAGYAAQ